MLTERFKKEILTYVEDILGSDAKGLFIYKDAIEGNCDPLDDTIYTNIDTLDSLYYDDITCYCGASKFVIEYRGYVIKIPFTGYWDYDEYDDNSVYLCGYWTEQNPCETEIELYEEASEKLKKILLPTIWIGNLNNCVPIYVQKKIDYDYEAYCAFNTRFKVALDNTSVPMKIIKKIRKIGFGRFSGIREYAIYNIIERFGIGAAARLLKELGDFNDLHSGNYGFINDDLVIFDYAGYDRFSWSNI